MQQDLSSKPNPFSNSRVDNPFQQHVDFSNVNKEQYSRLKSIVFDIQNDNNKQSQGFIVLGEAGTGKTHLMMRMAHDLLKTNRLLFIRQPNNPDGVIYHIYSRVLESLAEMVPGTQFSQLEMFLATSFSKIVLLEMKNKGDTNKHESIDKMLKQDAMNLLNYPNKLPESVRGNYWALIEKMILDWWLRKYGIGEQHAFLRGLVRFCSYNEPNKKALVSRWLSGSELEQESLEVVKLESWQDSIDREGFSIQAIEVFSKLSLMDAPLIMVFDQLEGLQYDELLLHKFGEAIKEVLTHVQNSLIVLNLIPDRWDSYKKIWHSSVIDRVSQNLIKIVKPTKEELKQIIRLKAKEQQVNIDKIFSEKDWTEILKQASIRAGLNRAADYYRYYAHDISLPEKEMSFEDEIKAQVKGMQEQIDQLKEMITKLYTASKLSLPDLKPTAAKKASQPSVYKTEDESIPSIPSLQDEEENGDNFAIPPVVKGVIETYIDQAKLELEDTYSESYIKPTILTESYDVGKVRAIVLALQSVIPLTTETLRLGSRKLPEHIAINLKNKIYVVGFLHSSGSKFVNYVKNFNELVLSYPDKKFILFRDSRDPVIRSEEAKSEIDKLKQATNGNFIMMDKDNRINLEVIYRMVVDIQNRDFEVDLGRAFEVLDREMSKYWLLSILKNKF